MGERVDFRQLPTGIRPLLQAPMAGTATPELAAAVSNAGGIGGIGAGSSSVEQAQALILATRQRTERPFNVNFFCHRPATRDRAREAAWLDFLRPLFAEFGATPPAELQLRYPSFIENPAMVDMLVETRPAIVSFIFGVPAPAVVARLHAAGIALLGCATTPAEAAQVAAAGLDAVVAQGAEAGGHRGLFHPEAGDARLGTLALTRLLARDCPLPVIAAGGIMDGAGIAAARRLGAAGVQLGTAFIPCPESAAPDAHRAALSGIGGAATEITDVISGRPARGIINRMHRDVARAGRPPLPDYPVAYDAAKALAAAAGKRGNAQFRAFWAGQGAPLARALPAAELVATLLREWQAADAAAQTPG